MYMYVYILDQTGSINTIIIIKEIIYIKYSIQCG